MRTTKTCRRACTNTSGAQFGSERKFHDLAADPFRRAAQRTKGVRQEHSPGCRRLALTGSINKFSVKNARGGDWNNTERRISMSKSANKRSAASSAGPVPAAKPSQAIAGKKTDAGSKQARVIAMLQWPAGATIAAFEPTTFTRCAPIRIIPCSDALKLSNNIMQKGLAFSRDWSGTVVISRRHRRSEITPRRFEATEAAAPEAAEAATAAARPTSTMTNGATAGPLRRWRRIGSRARTIRPLAIYFRLL
jgi:hypothetical protein